MPNIFHRSMPVLEVRDVVASAEWYDRVLDMKPGPFWGEPPCFCIVGRDGITVTLDQSREGDDGEDRVSPRNQYWAAYLYVEDVDALAADLTAKGIEILRGPVDQPYGCREIDIRDPDGHILGFGQDIAPSGRGPGL